MTGEPDGPPSSPGYSVVDNSTGIMAALGLVSMVLEGTGGQVDISLFDVMLSQLNYKAAAYLNGGGPPARQRAGRALVLRARAAVRDRVGHLALFVTHDEFWRRLCVEIDRPEWADDPRFATMHARFEHRDELLARPRRGAAGRVGGGVDGAAPAPRHAGRSRSPTSATCSTATSRARGHGGVGRHRRRSAAHGRQPDPHRRRAP